MMTSSYDRIAEGLLPSRPRPKLFARFSGRRLVIGTQSLHRTRQARIWRMFWRIKQARPQT